jgi:hypothetical protein
MLIFDCSKSDWDDADFVPDLADEWLTPVEVAAHQQQEQAQCQDGVSEDGPAPQRAPVPDEPPQRAPDPPSQRALDPQPPPEAPVNLLFEDTFMDAPPDAAPVLAPL